MQQVADHWDSALDYDDINAKIDSYFRRFTDSAPLFTIPNNAKVLDIDCRTAKGTAFFQKKYPTAKFTCSAMSPRFKKETEKELQKNNMSADVHVFTDIPLPFEDEQFDTVLTYETLEHTPWPEKYIAELSRVLKPGGTFVLTTPSVLWEPVHWLSAKLKLDHGEGPHRMVPRREMLEAFQENGLDVSIERSFVLIPAGPRWLLDIGKFFERIFPEWLLRILALRRTFICTKTNDIWWHKLKNEIVDTGLETQCGTSAGVSEGTLRYEEKNGIPILTRTEKNQPVPRAAYEGCAAQNCPYPELNKFTFGKLPENWLSGIVEKSFIGHTTDESIRREGASGGVLSAVLIYLLETKKIQGAICLQMGKSAPYKAEPIIARTKEEILSCAQSIYSVTPVNTILEQLDQENGPLAYVGLPDQVAAIRKLQMINHPSVRNIKYVLGPYMGTQMYFEAIRSFLRSHGVRSEKEIANLQYRAGEWPGHLQITLKDGRVLKAEKFYYNYLIPFFITRSSLQLVDFTNELTDISVGDAWSPEYEKKGGGHSVVLARSNEATKIIAEMKKLNLLTLQEEPLSKVLSMHGHMIDFKKRGSFIRMGWKKQRPEYGYEPECIPASRIATEWCLGLFFWTGSLSISRWAIEHIPIMIVGPVFNFLRKTWKKASKPTKRRGLYDMKFMLSS